MGKVREVAEINPSKCAIAKNLTNKLGFGSTEFHVIRPTNSILCEWIWHYLRQQSVREKTSFFLEIQELLGHKSSRTTEIYTHVSNKDIGKMKSPLDTIRKRR